MHSRKQMSGKKVYTLVIKLGTSSLVDEVTREPRIANMSLIVETLVKLRRQGHKVIIVSSGAIAVGLKRVGLQKKPKKLAQVQALAAIGQGRLIALWDDLFSQLNQPIAQILITRNDIIDYTQYKNAQNTMDELLNMDIIPIVNENDTLSVAEIKFGDNDTLSAITAGMANADYLFLMTDVDCLYTDNPRTNPDAQPILTVEKVSDLKVNTSSGGSDVGTGGMATKLIAAELATNAGVHTIITKSSNPGNILDIVHHIQNTNSDMFVSTTIEDQLRELKLHNIPLHTTFIGQPQDHKVKRKEFWLLHGLKTRGAIVIDSGCHNAIVHKTGGLLAAGIVDVRGQFTVNQCVDLVLAVDGAEKIVGKARVNYTAIEISKIKGCKSTEIEKVLGYADSEYVAHRENLAFPPAELDHN